MGLGHFYIEAGGIKVLFDAGESGVLPNNADMFQL
jgi:metal-dependent hydrolase (beta-lactamase superfamily II)